MTHCKSTGTTRKEAQVQTALMTVRTDDKNTSEAIRDFDVPRQTFYHHLNGIPLQYLVHKMEHLLSHSQKKELYNG